jgi:hypothetical protein
MPGFDILQQPLQYHPPVAPEVPVPDNTGAKIIAAGAETAVNGFIRAAIARRQADLEQQDIIQRGHIAERQLEVEQDRTNKTYALGLKGQDVTRQGNYLDYSIRDRNMDLEEELLPYKEDALDALTSARNAKAKRDMATIKQTANMIEEAGKDATGLGLFDSEFQRDHPMQYAANAYGFRRLWEATAEPKLQKTIKMFVDRANASKATLPDPVTGKPTKYPWAQIGEDIKLKGLESPFVEQLVKAGYFTREVSEDMVKTQNGLVPKVINRKAKPELQKILDDLKGASFGQAGKLESKVPGFGTGALPDPELSQAEQEAEIVKRRIAEEPENEAALRQRYSERNPGSESLLDEDSGGGADYGNVQ